MGDDRMAPPREDDCGSVTDGAQLPPAVEPRILAAWRAWLAALAVDPEAAISAAHVYGELEPAAREAWLAALVEDAPRLDVPLVAIYAPLLAVETDPDRRERIELLLAEQVSSPRLPAVRALHGVARGGAHIAVLISPLYLRFVRVLSCRYRPHVGFEWAHHDPIVLDADAPSDGTEVDNARLETTPLNPVIEELAHAILAHGRRGLEIPEALHPFADLFDAHVDELAV